MKTLKHSLVAAAALVVLGSLTHSPAAGAAANQPEEGVGCPSGFTAQLAGGRMKCVMPLTKDISNTSGRECLQDAPFKNFQKMSNNRDICVHEDSSIPGNANLADFENGQVIVRIPVGAPLPRSLQGRAPLRVVNGIRFFRINENADFLFYDRSRSISTVAALARVASEAVIRQQLNIPNNQISSKSVSVSTAQVDSSGSLDKVQARIDLFVFPQP